MYATLADLIQRIPADEIAQRADTSIPRLVTGALLVALSTGADLSAWAEDEQQAGAAAVARINLALAGADSEINGYLAGRYGHALPLVTPPLKVVDVACDLARHALHADQATEAQQKRHAAAIAWLRDVSAGRVALDIPGAAPAPAASGARMDSAPAVWRRESATGFI